MSTTVDDAPLTTRSVRDTIWVYRPELDGLRTLAVFLVLLFHSAVGAFGGGFIGVDVFFVLSGFLVSSILLDEAWSRGTIDLPRFLARRVRRLLPAAVVVVLATSVISVLTSVMRQANAMRLTFSRFSTSTSVCVAFIRSMTSGAIGPDWSCSRT